MEWLMGWNACKNGIQMSDNPFNEQYELIPFLMWNYGWLACFECGYPTNPLAVN